MFSLFRTALPTTRLLLLCALPVLATAQSAEPPSQIPAPQAYASVFDEYKPYSDETIVPWTQANAKVANIGGWRAYAKEAALPDTNASGNTPSKTPQHQHHHPEAPK